MSRVRQEGGGSRPPSCPALLRAGAASLTEVPLGSWSRWTFAGVPRKVGCRPATGHCNGRSPRRTALRPLPARPYWEGGGWALEALKNDAATFLSPCFDARRKLPQRSGVQLEIRRAGSGGPELRQFHPTPA